MGVDDGHFAFDGEWRRWQRADGQLDLQLHGRADGHGDRGPLGVLKPPSTYSRSYVPGGSSGNR